MRRWATLAIRINCGHRKDMLLSTGPSPDFACISGSAYGMELTVDVLSRWWQARLLLGIPREEFPSANSIPIFPSVGISAEF